MRNIARADFNRAMLLLGLDPEDPVHSLVRVTIEGGRVHAEFAQINIVHTQKIGDDDV